MKHKKILFDELAAEKPKNESEAKIMIYNGVVGVATGFFKVVGIVLASLIVSLFLTVFITSVVQEKSMLDVVMEFTEKFIKLFQ